MQNIERKKEKKDNKTTLILSLPVLKFLSQCPHRCTDAYLILFWPSLLKGSHWKSASRKPLIYWRGFSDFKMHYNVYTVFIEISLPILVELLHIAYIGQCVLKYNKKINPVCNRLLKRCNTDATKRLVNMH